MKWNEVFAEILGIIYQAWADDMGTFTAVNPWNAAFARYLERIGKCATS